MKPAIEVSSLSKSFTLHAQGGVRIPVLDQVYMTVSHGQCIALNGPSGSGKSTFLRSLYGNYKPQEGSILVQHGETRVDMAHADPREILHVRRYTMGFVSQFLRVIPRVPALKIVAEPLRRYGATQEEAEEKAAELLERLNIPRRLWALAPATFSGGEQQRINIARGFAVPYPILLLDEPTASLDVENREIVMSLIREAKAGKAALVGIFHDDEIREAVADRVFEMRVGEK